MSQQITLPASLHRMAVDAEGEATLTFKVPRSNIVEALEVAELTEALLSLTIAVKSQQRKMEFAASANGKDKDDDDD